MPVEGNAFSKFASAAFGARVESHDLPPHRRVQTGRKPSTKGTRAQACSIEHSGHRHVSAACGGCMGSHDLPPHRRVQTMYEKPRIQAKIVARNPPCSIEHCGHLNMLSPCTSRNTQSRCTSGTVPRVSTCRPQHGQHRHSGGGHTD